MLRRLLLLILLTAAAPASALLFTGPPGTAQQQITGISLSAGSFAGGAAAGTTIGAITVTVSPATPAFSGTLALSGTQTGSGNDAASFQIVGSELETASGGTDQPGQYAIAIVATGANYTNSGFSQPETIQATGPGGSGWQLAFSDEFVCPNAMLECLSTVAASALTWTQTFCSGLASPSAEGCGVLTVAALPNGITAANCTGTRLGACDVSIAGATNSGNAGNAAVNGTFLVADVPDLTHIDLYMPYGGIAAAIGGTITVGSGPWVTALNTSCTSGPCSGLPLTASNDNSGESEGWDPHACVVAGANLFQIDLTNSGSAYLTAAGAATANYIPPAAMQISGNPFTSTMCHIQTWTGSAGFGQTEEVYEDANAEFPTGLQPHPALWTVATSNVWNTGPEVDWPECFGSCADHVLGGIDAGTSVSVAYIQFGVDISSSTVTFYQNGTQVNSGSNPFPGTTWYPLADATVDNSGNRPTFPSSLSLHYLRVYKKVATGACYAAIPTAASGTIPHTGSC